MKEEKLEPKTHSTAEDMMAEFDRPTKKKTDEEKKADLETARKARSGLVTVTVRNITKINLDLVQLAGIIALSMLAGYCLSFIVLSFSVAEIKLGIRNFFEIITILIADGLLVVWKLYTPPGAIAKELIRSAARNENELDQYGRTIVK